MELILVLAITGIFFIAAEIFLPGGVAGFLGAILSLGATISAFQISVSTGFTVLVCQLAGGLLCCFLALKLMPHTPMGKFLILNDALPPSGSQEKLPLEIGQIGTATTPLRPSGKVKFEQTTYDASSDGELIEPGETVKILEIHGTRLTVTRETAN